MADLGECTPSKTSNTTNNNNNNNNNQMIADDQYIKKILEDKPKKLDMGCRWTEEELDIFLKYFRSSGLNEMDLMQNELQQHGYKRSINNLLSVYLKNRNFLSINTQCTAKDLYAIMADHYDSLEVEISDKQPLRQIVTKPDNIIEQKRKISPFNTKYIHSTDSHKSHKTEETNLLKRKSMKAKKIASTGQSLQNTPQIENYENYFHKNKRINLGNENFTAKKRRKSMVSPSKISFTLPIDEHNLFKKIEFMSRGCMGKLNRKSTFPSKKNPLEDLPFTPAFLRYINCELFYSSIDKPYFGFNEFQYALGDPNNGKKYKRAEWYIIRSCLGKPRRYSNKFIKSQLEELNYYRTAVRHYLYNKGNLSEFKLHPFLLQKIKELKPMLVSQTILAFHPVCNHMHGGSILTTTSSNAIIKFYPNDLGVVNVPDTKILVLSDEDPSIFTESYYTRPKNSGLVITRTMSEPEPDTKQSTQQKILQDLDFNALAFFIKLLERKAALINELKNFNDLAESNSASLNDKFYQEYGWTVTLYYQLIVKNTKKGIQINLLDNALKHVVAKSRLRGLSHFNVNQVMNGFNKLLANPMKKFMEIEQKFGSLNFSEMDSDLNTNKEFKNLMDKSSEQMINDQIKSMISKYHSSSSQKEHQNSGDVGNENSNDHDHNGNANPSGNANPGGNTNGSANGNANGNANNNANDNTGGNLLGNDRASININSDTNNNNLSNGNRDTIIDHEQNLESKGQRENESNGIKMEIEKDDNKIATNSGEANKTASALSSLIIDDIDELKRVNLIKLTENIIGILLTLKNNGELNITENRYLTDLCNSIYEENPDEFHQINKVLLNISSK